MVKCKDDPEGVATRYYELGILIGWASVGKWLADKGTQAFSDHKDEIALALRKLSVEIVAESLKLRREYDEKYDRDRKG
jgi:hypothetical protein